MNKPVTYNKTLLAKVYGTNTRTLQRWIDRNDELSRKLKETGYNTKHKGPYILTLRQVSLIFQYLGTPYEVRNLIKEL